ncbi:hypothetical protein LWF15_34835 [Kineosporia rhizophila]|uniref:hypothetical protein n=1 Tax=Kineosporia rhizophila TaxID=84633 RepID=UPI000AE3F819|nr:hypothetical protein [Kineosporia rhizophila]MCE0540682.1 hypothetical protein [Kineosporia rhizophila]
MNRRYAALALAAALVVPGAAASAASASALSASSAVKSDRNDGPKQDRSGKDDKSTKNSKDDKSGKKTKAKTVIYNGTLSAVDASAGTLTVKVRGGRDKKLRTTGLTLQVPDSVKITRNGKSVKLADLKVGDKVTVQTRQAAKVITLVRVTAKGVKATPTPDPTESTEPTPTETPEPSETPEPDASSPDDSDDDSTPTPTPTA